MKHITISIEYAGLTLPVVKNEQGIELVPLKPLVEIFGLDWMTQYRKLKDAWMVRFLGVCIGLMPYGGSQKRDMVSIRLDRVVAYLMTINPDRVRANGNTSGADFLEARLNEWADALHDYEALGSAVNDRHHAVQTTLRAASAAVKLIRAKALTEDQADRTVIDGLLKNLSRENGIPYQSSLL